MATGARDAAIVARADAGETKAEIARDLGLSPTRVSQIVARAKKQPLPPLGACERPACVRPATVACGVDGCGHVMCGRHARSFVASSMRFCVEHFRFIHGRGFSAATALIRSAERAAAHYPECIWKAVDRGGCGYCRSRDAHSHTADCALWAGDTLVTGERLGGCGYPMPAESR